MCEGYHGSGAGEPCCGRGGQDWHHGGGGGHRQHRCCHAGHHRQQGCGCGGHPFSFHRRFSAREEEEAALEQYLKDLEAEAKGVRERLTELRGS
jgi:hypothetical protein